MKVEPDCTIGELRDYLSQRSNTYINENITHNGIAVPDNARIISYYPRVFYLELPGKTKLRDADEYIAEQTSANKQPSSFFDSKKRSASSFSGSNKANRELNEVNRERKNNIINNNNNSNDNAVLQTCNNFNNNDKSTCLSESKDDKKLSNNKISVNKTSNNNNYNANSNEEEQEEECFIDKAVNRNPNVERRSNSKGNTVSHEQSVKPKKCKSKTTKLSNKDSYLLNGEQEANDNCSTEHTSINENYLQEVHEGGQCITLTCKVPAHNLTVTLVINTNNTVYDILSKLHEQEPAVDIKGAKIVLQDKVYSQDNKNTLFNLGIRANKTIYIASEDFANPEMCKLINLCEQYNVIKDEINNEYTEERKKEIYESLMRILLQTDALESLTGS